MNETINLAFDVQEVNVILEILGNAPIKSNLTNLYVKVKMQAEAEVMRIETAKPVPPVVGPAVETAA